MKFLVTVIDEFQALPALVFEPKKTQRTYYRYGYFFHHILVVSAPVKFEVGLPRFTFS
jgi:hypothetical protein